MILYSQQFPDGDAETVIPYVYIFPYRNVWPIFLLLCHRRINSCTIWFQFAKHVFRTFDADGDKKLDFREFMTALNMTARAGPQERLKWAFQMYDIDQSGEITLDECEVLLQ